jgi:hypothetical protein
MSRSLEEYSSEELPAGSCFSHEASVKSYLSTPIDTGSRYGAGGGIPRAARSQLLCAREARAPTEGTAAHLDSARLLRGFFSVVKFPAGDWHAQTERRQRGPAGTQLAENTQRPRA